MLWTSVQSSVPKRGFPLRRYSASSRAELTWHEVCTDRYLKKSFTYIIKDPSLEVVKIGKGDNDLGGSAKSTIERYRRLPKKVVGKPRKYGSRTGPAAIMRKRMLAARAAAAAAQQEATVSCCLWVYFLPDVMVPPDVMDPAHVKLGAGGLEQPLVRAYVLGNNGEYPAGNVQEKGGKNRSWAAGHRRGTGPLQ